MRIRVQVPQWKFKFLGHNTFAQFPLGCVRREIIGWFGYSIVTYIISVQPLSQASPRRASFITVTSFGTTAILGEGELIKGSSHKIACHVIMYLNVELKLALVAIQKCLVLLHDYLGPNTTK